MPATAAPARRTRGCGRRRHTRSKGDRAIAHAWLAVLQMSRLAELRAGLARRVPHGLRAVYHGARALLPRRDPAYDLLRGKTLRKLRSDVLRLAAGEETQAVSNCGLVAYGSGFMGIYKEGTFNSCWELAIRLPRSSVPGVGQTLWLAEFDSGFRLLGKRKLDTSCKDGSMLLPDAGIVEDTRLVRHGNAIVVTANFVPYPAGPESFPAQRRAWPLIGLLDVANARVEFNRLELAGVSAPQKNWIPFSVNGQLLLEYSVNPHRILVVDPGTGSCEDAWLTSYPPCDEMASGYLKGGAPPVPIGESLLGACHAWELNADGQRDYKTYFYLFSPAPPFRITGISRPLKLVVPHRIQYLTGMVHCPEDKSLFLSFGVCDCDNYFVRVPLERVLGLVRA